MRLGRLTPAVLGITLYSMARGLAIPAFRVLLPLYMLSVGYRTQDLGPMATIASAATAALLPLVGRAVDSGWARWVGTSSGLLVAASLLIPWASHTYAALTLAYALAVLGMMVWQPARSAVTVAEVGPAALGRAFTGFSAAFTISRIASPLIAVWLAGAVGYVKAMAAFSAVAVAGAAAFHTLSRGFRQRPRAGGRPRGGGLRAALLGTYARAFRLVRSEPMILLFAILDRFGWTLWLPMLNAYLKEACGLGNEGVGLFNSIFAAAMLATFYPVGRFADRAGPLKTLFLNEVVGAAATSLLILTYFGSPATAFVAGFVMGVSVELWIAGFNTLTTLLRGPERVGEVRTGIDSARMLASIPAPSVGSALYSLCGPTAPFTAGVALLIAAASSIASLAREREAVAQHAARAKQVCRVGGEAGFKPARGG